MSDPVWQILDVGSIWMKEFASALAALAPTIAWTPDMRRLSLFAKRDWLERLTDPPLEIHHFPLQRGYARPGLAPLLRFENAVLHKLMRSCTEPARSTLICSTPFYAPVAEKWPGPVVYYVTDFTAGYAGINSSQVRALDRRMCTVAAAVCPNSARLASYLVDSAGCAPGRITIVPNATRQSNVSPAPLREPGPLPPGIRHLPRPIAGVIGNLAANLDWQLLAEAIPQTPDITWVFVGPSSMPVPDRSQAEARRWVMRHAHFTGSKSYGELQSYARALDVAVLPYIRREPTYSGSSTRFYEHLAACRPMVATRGFAELLEKPPLLELVDTAHQLATVLQRLQHCNFHDGLEEQRWEESRHGTWTRRAEAMLRAVHSAPNSANL